MKEFEIEIDENGNISADSKGFHGPLCEQELNDILDGIEGNEFGKKKPEYFSKEKNSLQLKKFIHQGNSK